MKTAQSNHIEAFDYDDQNRRLIIQFTNGSVYSYSGVDPNTYYALSQSGSPGSYFHSKIKGNFNTTLLAKGDAKKR